VAAAAAPPPAPPQPDLPKLLTGLSTKLSAAVTSVESKLSHKMDEIRQEIGSVANALTRPVPKELGAPTPDLNEDLEGVARTVKRAMVEVFERSSDRMANQLVRLRRTLEETARRAESVAPALAEHLSICLSGVGVLLDELGVETFEAEVGEYFDPMIHQCVTDESRRISSPAGSCSPFRRGSGPAGETCSSRP